MIGSFEVMIVSLCESKLMAVNSGVLILSLVEVLEEVEVLKEVEVALDTGVISWGL